MAAHGGGGSGAGAQQAAQQQQRAASQYARDRTACAASTCILVAALAYNISVAARLRQLRFEGEDAAHAPAAASVVRSMSAHVGLELGFLVWLGRRPAPALYVQHRNSCVMIYRTVILLLMLAYIPQTWGFTAALELHSGRATTITVRMILAFAVVQISDMALYRLPLRLALPLHAARGGLITLTLRQLARVITHHPEMAAVAAALWAALCRAFCFGSAFVLGGSSGGGSGCAGGSGSSGGDSGSCAAPAVAPCVVPALVIFQHVCFCLLLPLYVMCAWHVAEQRALARSVAASQQPASGGGGDMAAAMQHAAGSAPSSRHDEAGSSSSRGGAAGASSSGGDGSRSRSERGARAIAAPLPPGQGELACHCHAPWPLHFTLLLHTALLFSLMGVSFAAVGAGTTLWHRARHGVPYCLLPP